MASSLRKRLSKRQAIVDLKGTASDGESSSRSSSNEDLDPKLTKEKDDALVAQKRSSKLPIPIERESKPHARGAARESSPSFTFRHAKRASPCRATSETESSLESVASSSERESIHSSVFGEQFATEQNGAPSKYTNHSAAPHNEVHRETKYFKGVEFEMMNTQHAEVVQPPVPSKADGDISHPSRNTRSQTRRQERADSHSSCYEGQDSAKQMGLTIRKVSNAERSPPALTGADENSMHDATPDTPSDGRTHHHLTPRTSIASNGRDKSTSPASSSSISPNGTPRLSSYRRHQQSKLERDDIPATVVLPPIFNRTIPTGYIWVSHLSSSSRPSEPWGNFKKWTCCQCAVLDPRGNGQPAETMVEQRVCARVECGHERCALGCRVYRTYQY